MTRHQKNEAHGVRGREDAIGSATARGGENRAGTRAVRTNRSSFELPRRSRPGTRDREHRSPPPGVPENPTGTRARFGTAGTRVFKMARGSTGPSPLRLAGRDAARLREPRGGLESSARAAAGFTGRDARRIRKPPASFRSRPTASLLMIRSPLVSFRAIGFGETRGPRRAHAPSLPSAGVRSRGALQDSEDALTNASSFRVGHARTGAAAVAIDGGSPAVWRA